jgi:hypothetical protein
VRKPSELGTKKPAEAGRAWFVEDLEHVQSARAILGVVFAKCGVLPYPASQLACCPITNSVLIV